MNVEDTDDSEDSQTETADIKTAGKDSSDKESKKTGFNTKRLTATPFQRERKFTSWKPCRQPNKQSLCEEDGEYK